MTIKACKEWSIEIHKHGFSRMKQSFKDSSRKIRLEVKDTQPSSTSETVWEDFTFELDEHDDVLLVVLQYKKMGRNDSTQSPIPSLDDVDDEHSTSIEEEDDLPNNEKSWIPKYFIRVQDVEIIKQKKKRLTLTFFTKKDFGTEDQDYIFESEEEANSFAESLQALRSSIDKRTKQYMKDHHINRRETTTLEVDVLSAFNLKVANKMKNSSDPYCVVRIGEKEMYRTEVIQNTIEPVWADSSASSKIFSASSQDLLSHGLTFEVLDWEQVLKDKPLGRVNVSLQNILDSNNERMELNLNQDKLKDKKQGTLVIKCSKCEEYDMSNLPQQKMSPLKDMYSSKTINETEIDDEDGNLDESFVSWNIIDCKERTGKINLAIESKSLVEHDDILSMFENGQISSLSADDVIWFQLFRSRSDNKSMKESIQSSLKLSNRSNSSDADDEIDSAVPVCRFRLEDIRLKPRYRSVVHIEFKRKKDERFEFESINDAKHFTEIMEICNEFALEQKKSFLRSSGRMAKENMWYLLEVISALDLREANQPLARSDPFCVVKIGDKDIHRTSKISGTLQPIWTHETKSLTLFSSSMREMSNGIRFELYDWQMVGKNQSLGQAHMTGKDILEFLNKEKVLKVYEETGDYRRQGTLKVRIREASSRDMDFMRKEPTSFLDHVLQERGLQNPQDFLAPSKVKKSFMLSTTKFINKKTGPHGEKLFRVTPYPDPLRIKETTWLSANSIEEASRKPSQSWIQAGSGNLGHLFVEVIGCDQLYESTVSRLDKIDPFVSLVYEDVVVSTEVVKNTRSPRFMPWTRRAFMFNIDHNRSQLFVGVFDLQKTQIVQDNPIGRLTVDLGNLQPGKEYTLQYNISQSARVYPRKFTGIITLRISVEYDERKAFWRSAVPYIQYDINSTTSNDRNLIQYAIRGNSSEENYSYKVLFSYLDELASVLNSLLDIPLRMIPTIFWRTSHVFKFSEYFQISLPINSIVVFIQALLMVERPHLIPSVILANLGYMMYSSLEQQRMKLNGHCYRPRSYFDLIRIATIGKSQSQALIDMECDIGSRNDPEDGNPIEDIKKMPEVERLLARLSVTLENIWTLFAFGSEYPLINGVFNPVSYILQSLQYLLAVITGPIRAVSKIYQWEAHSAACLITTFCFTSSFLFYIAPWAHIFQWMARFFVWICLGPLMRKVDAYFVRKDEKPPKMIEDQIDRVFDSLQRKRELYDKSIAFKKHLFGEHVLQTPGFFTPDRYTDEPLSSSSAKSFPDMKLMSKKVNIVARLHGHNLEVDMIPSIPESNSPKSDDPDLKEE